MGFDVKCDHCPLRDSPSICPGSQNTRVCQLADGDSPEHNPAILPHIHGFDRDNRGKVDRGINTLRLINGCKYRSTRSVVVVDGTEKAVHVIKQDDGPDLTFDDCGCGMHRCLLKKGRGDGLVNYQDCTDCVMSEGKEKAPE